MKLNGTAKLVIPIATIVMLIIGLHVLQQGELGKMQSAQEESRTAIARVDERTEAQFAEIMRSLERIEKGLE